MKIEKNLLLVDTDEAMLRLLSELLKSQGGFLNLFSASSTSEAIAIVQNRKIDLIITAIRAERVDGFWLVSSLARNSPDTKIIVMTEIGQNILRARIESIDSVVLIDERHDISMLTRRVFTELQLEYGGHVRGINLPSFLQMMELECCTCCLRVEAKNRHGYLWIRGGDLIAAQTDREKGKDAALEIIGWKNVFIDIDYTPHNVQPTIPEVPLMRLILESEIRYDERRANGKNRRKHERYDLLVAIDYDIKNMKRHCLLRDISLEGACIETDYELAVDQEITLTLSSPASNSSCFITARVVRVDEYGVGVQFQIDNPAQRQVIKAVINASIRASLTRESKGASSSLPV